MSPLSPHRDSVDDTDDQSAANSPMRPVNFRLTNTSFQIRTNDIDAKERQHGSVIPKTTGKAVVQHIPIQPAYRHGSNDVKGKFLSKGIQGIALINAFAASDLNYKEGTDESAWGDIKSSGHNLASTFDKGSKSVNPRMQISYTPQIRVRQLHQEYYRNSSTEFELG